MGKTLVKLFIISLISLSGCDDSSNIKNCGNGVVDIGEECDQDDFGGKSCESLGYYGGNPVCNADCTIDLQDCMDEGWCGNGEIDGEEECDGNTQGKTCSDFGQLGGAVLCSDECMYDLSMCSVPPSCGDGERTDPEQCDKTDFGGETCLDYGYNGENLICTTSCMIDYSQCVDNGYCGDGETNEPWEECDGDDLNGESCESLGYYGNGTIGCKSDCTIDFLNCERCGDGTIQEGFEACEETTDRICRNAGFLSGEVRCVNCQDNFDNCTNSLEWGGADDDYVTDFIREVEMVESEGVDVFYVLGHTNERWDGGSSSYASTFLSKIGKDGNVEWTSFLDNSLAHTISSGLTFVNDDMIMVTGLLYSDQGSMVASFKVYFDKSTGDIVSENIAMDQRVYSTRPVYLEAEGIVYIGGNSSDGTPKIWKIAEDDTETEINLSIPSDAFYPADIAIQENSYPDYSIILTGAALSSISVNGDVYQHPDESGCSGACNAVFTVVVDPDSQSIEAAAMLGQGQSDYLETNNFPARLLVDGEYIYISGTRTDYSTEVDSGFIVSYSSTPGTMVYIDRSNAPNNTILGGITGSSITVSSSGNCLDTNQILRPCVFKAAMANGLFTSSQLDISSQVESNYGSTAILTMLTGYNVVLTKTSDDVPPYSNAGGTDLLMLQGPFFK
ncbi:MAG: hypothetical protein JXR95_02615 [Deltaproteobacteria bacterium]|nr:hypothetical protein [Deltaproteobacteria bacterium]